MRLPRLAGRIERRLLVNFRVDPAVTQAWLPAPFRPQVVHGYSVAGICLIRLAAMRPAGLPSWTGLGSENAAHRVAVEWDSDEGVRTGVFIPRRDSNSVVNSVVGGRLFPGAHHRADFQVSESESEIRIAFAAHDGSASASVAAHLEPQFSGSRLFGDLDEASAFFECGRVGYSATRDERRFDGLALHTTAWKVEPATITEARSSVFDDETLFPAGSAELDCTLVMRNVPVSWLPLEPLRTLDPSRLSRPRVGRN